MEELVLDNLTITPAMVFNQENALLHPDPTNMVYNTKKTPELLKLTVIMQRELFLWARDVCSIKTRYGVVKEPWLNKAAMLELPKKDAKIIWYTRENPISMFQNYHQGTLWQ